MGIHAAGDFFAWRETEGYVDGKGRAWYSGIAFCICPGMVPGKGVFYAKQMDAQRDADYYLCGIFGAGGDQV